MVVGPNYKHLLPMALVMGAGFLLIVDDVARNIMTSEIPLGILTAIIGAPVFVFLLVKGRRGWV
jgi:iron complex transport system permease protein